jgi:hypothetical protein
MSRTNARRAGLALALLLVPAAFAAQAPADTARAAAPEEVEVYRREVFQYQRAGRPDPFQPLTGSPELAIRPEDLQLSGLVYSPNPRESVASFIVPGTNQRIRLRTGERFGAMTLVAVYPAHVNVRVDEFGTSRTYSIQLRRRPAQEDSRAGGAALEMESASSAGAAAAPEAQPQAQPQQTEPAPPRAPQRRGSRAAQPATP